MSDTSWVKDLLHGLQPLPLFEHLTLDDAEFERMGRALHDAIGEHVNAEPYSHEMQYVMVNEALLLIVDRLKRVLPAERKAFMTWCVKELARASHQHIPDAEGQDS